MGGGRQGLRLAEHDIGGGDGRFEERAGMRHVSEIDQAGHLRFARNRIIGFVWLGPTDPADQADQADPADQDILVVCVVVDELAGE